MKIHKGVLAVGLSIILIVGLVIGTSADLGKVYLATIMLSGNAALGQYDTLTLLGDGTNCLQISKADN